MYPQAATSTTMNGTTPISSGGSTPSPNIPPPLSTPSAAPSITPSVTSTTSPPVFLISPISISQVLCKSTQGSGFLLSSPCFSTSLNVVITCCPLLEDLHVTFHSKDEGERMILDIDAPSLRWLKLSKLAINIITVTSAPVLEIASILSCYYDVNDEEKEEEDDKNSVSGGRNDILMKIFGGMTFIRELKLDKEFVLFLGSGHAAERIPVTFGNLKAVHLSADFG